ncbi:hypothetical protein FPG59_13815, partial [Flavobacterium sp. FPG59]
MEHYYYLGLDPQQNFDFVVDFFLHKTIFGLKKNYIELKDRLVFCSLFYIFLRNLILDFCQTYTY